MKRILDPAFRYRPSYDTNVRETFERARREQQRPVAAQARPSAAVKSLDDRLDARRRVA